MGSSQAAEFERTGVADCEAVEQGFRGFFRGFNGFEQMIQNCRFPRVRVHPLTVYRSVAPNSIFQRTTSGTF